MAAGVRVRLVGVLLVVTVWPPAVAAQTTDAPPDLAAQDAVTLRQAVDEIRAALAAVNPGFDNEERELSRELSDALATLEASGALEAPLRSLVKGTPADFFSTARRRQGTFASSTFLGSSTLCALWDTVRTARNRNQGVEHLPVDQPRGILKRLQDDPHVDTAALADMFRAYDQVDAVLQQLALEHARDRLGRYERKFGPGSVRLNALEVGIAYLLQGAKGFGYDPDVGPGPLEVIASYTTTYFSYAHEEVQLVSAAEFGVRHYNFGRSWGRGGFRGFLKPRHWSVGAVWAGKKDGPLVLPGSGGSRFGVFGAWGDVKVAYVHGANNSGRLLVSRQFQILPLIF